MATDRIVIGKRTGFAFYRDHKRDRKILIGVFESNARVNSYYDGPFDQLPDNFIEGEALRSAILATEPELAGKIDRFGGEPTGTSRFMIAPYLHYRSEDQLQIFHTCAESKQVPADSYYACFVIEQDYGAEAAQSGTEKKKVASRKKAARSKSPPKER
jgi:hypothetical protein